MPPCLAPWIALSVKPNGDVGPDAQFSGAYGNILHQTLDEILSSESFTALQREFSEGRFAKGCQNCHKKEVSLGHSRRIFFEHTLRAFNEDLEQKPNHYPNIQYLDLNLSNKCNLKCRMCNSVSSTSWLAEDRELIKRHGQKLHRPENTHPEKISLKDVLKIFENRDYFKNLRYLALRGGEPLLEIENIKVLEKIVDWGLAPQVTLDISTNGTVISPQLLSLMSYFEQVDLYVSVEGSGELYKYIRGGESFPIESLENHLIEFRKIPNLTLKFTVAVSIYNIFNLDELWDWFEKVYRPFDEITLSNVVVRPEYLNFQILPVELKRRALEKIESSRILEGPHHTGRRMIGDSGKQLIRASLQKEIYSPEQKAALLEKFCTFTHEVDQMRGTSLLKHVPELAPIFDVNERSRLLRVRSGS